MTQASKDLDKEIEHQQSLLKVYERNLRNVEINISKSGAIVPTSLANERDEYTDKVNEIRQKIQELEQQKQSSAPSNPPAQPGQNPATSAQPSDEITLSMQSNTGVSVCIIYASEDKVHRDRLAKHLAGYVRYKTINVWDRSNGDAGLDEQQQVNSHIDTAQVVLLLLSPSFSSSEVCLEDMDRAMERRGDRNTIVIPIYVLPVHMPGAPFEGLLSLPRNKQPVSTWSRSDDAWYDVAVDIYRVCKGLLPRP